MLKNRRILLGISGSIAAYKMAETVRLLKKAGATVHILMTQEATRFITPLTLGTLAENEVMVDVFPRNETGSWTKHIHLGLSADLFLIAPATAQTLAKLAHGFCDNMLTAVALAARCPIVIAPAMDHDMYEHPATQANLQQLAAYGYDLIAPAHGELASGLVGKGRLPEPIDLVAYVTQKLHPDQPLKGQKVLLTAGPTQEAIDPVRYISNHSTGTMGYALAEVAQRLGAIVTLVSGPVHLPVPTGVTCLAVTSAAEMHAAVQAQFPQNDWFIACAAVADYTPETVATQKIKKADDDLKILLKKTPDILFHAGQQKQSGQTVVGFALETNDGYDHALGKLRRKNLDYIVLNELTNTGAGFGTSTNQVTILDKEGHRFEIALAPKKEVAQQIWRQLLKGT